MRIVNMHEAKTQLSKLVAGAVEGEPFIIARAGKPLVKVVPVDAPERVPTPRLGFLAGRFKVPDDFDDMMSDEIIAMFEGEEQ